MSHWIEFGLLTGGLCIAMFGSGCVGAGPSPGAALWEPLAPLPVGNSGFSYGCLDGNLVLLGGTTRQDAQTKLWLADVWTYRIGADQWRKAGTLDRPVAYAAFGQDEEGLYVLGGRDETSVTARLLRVDGELTVHTVSPAAVPVVYSGAVAADGRLYVVAGGTHTPDMDSLTDACFRVNLADGGVENLPAYPGGGVMVPAAVRVGDEILAWGGATYDAAAKAVRNTDQAFAYSLSRNRWRRIRDYPARCRGLSACTLNDEWVLVAGGFDDALANYSDRAFLYNVRQDRYAPAPPLAYAGMCQALVRHGDTLYLFGGEDRRAPGHRSDQLYRCRVADLLRFAK